MKMIVSVDYVLIMIDTIEILHVSTLSCLSTMYVVSAIKLLIVFCIGNMNSTKNSQKMMFTSMSSYILRHRGWSKKGREKERRNKKEEG